MKTRLLLPCIFTLLTLSFSSNIKAQELLVNKTLFIGCDNAGSEIKDGIETDDGSLVFIGDSGCDNKGDITAPNKGDRDVIVGKLDKDQKLIWVKQFGGSVADGARAICRSQNGKDYAVLIQTTSTDGDIPTPVNGGNCWIILIDETGNIKWSKTFGSTGADGGLSIAATRDTGFILLGSSNGSDGDVPFQYNPSPFSQDWFVVKMDSLGNRQWYKTIGGTGDESEFGTIIEALGGYYLVGASNSKDHDCVDTQWTHKNTKSDYFILRLNDTGKVEWSRRHGTSEGEGISDAVWDKRDSSIVIVGYTWGNDLIAAGNHGQSDMLTVKVDKDGNLVWARLLGGKESDNIFQSVCMVGNHEYAAYTKSSSPNLGGDDTWLFILDKDGNTVQDIVVGGQDDDYVGSVIPYKGDLMLVGQTASKQFTKGTGSSSFTTSSTGYFSLLHYFPLSITEKSISGNYQIELVPNPATKKVRVQLPSINTAAELTLLNNTGKRIAAYRLPSNTTNFLIDTRQLPEGIYLVSWTSENATITKRLIIHH